jgi:hypothetical protein
MALEPTTPVPSPKDAQQLWAGRLLENLKAIEKTGVNLDGLKDIRTALWAVLRG